MSQNSAIIISIIIGCLLFWQLAHAIPHNSPPPSLQTTPESANIVIIGGGVAGLYSAYLLQKNGFKNITILEARDRVGGRIQTVTVGETRLYMGAEYLHLSEVRPNIAYEFLKKYGKGTYPKRNTIFEDGHNRTKFESLYQTIFISTQEEMNDLDEFWETVKKSGNLNSTKIHLPSLGNYLKQRYEDLKSDILLKTNMEKYGEVADAMFNAVLLEVSDDSGEDSFKLSSLMLGRVSSDDMLMVAIPSNGMSEIIEILQTHIDADRIKLNEVVTTVKFQKTITVKTESKNVYEADHVIVTLPLGVLQDKAATMFDPPLPDRKQKAIELMNPGSYSKIFFRLNGFFKNLSYTPLWLDKINILSKDLDKRNFNGSDWNRFISIIDYDASDNFGGAYIVGEGGRYAETLTAEKLIDGLYECLKNTIRPALPIPKPEFIGRTSWMSDPFTRGAYSSISPGCDSQLLWTGDLATSINDNKKIPRILFAGEATSMHAIATAHGAMESAIREATRLTKLYNGEDGPLHEI